MTRALSAMVGVAVFSALLSVCLGAEQAPSLRRWRVRACSALLGARLSQAREHDRGWVAPADAAARANPLATVARAAEGGRRIFAERCSACHGDEGRGTPRAPDLTQAEVQAQSDGALFWKIGRGNSRRGMPTFSFLPEAQRWQLVLWLRALASSHGRPE